MMQTTVEDIMVQRVEQWYATGRKQTSVAVSSLVGGDDDRL